MSTGFFTLGEIADQLLNEAAEQIQSTFTRCVHSIYTLDHRGELTHLGSCSTCSYLERRFLLTAHHVLKEAQFENLSIFGNHGLVDIEAEFFVTGRTSSLEEDSLDLAYADITDISELSGLESFDLDRDAVSPHQRHANGRHVGTLGYPNTKNEPKRDKTIRGEPHLVASLVVEPGPKTIDLGYNAQSHVHIRHAPKRYTNESGRRVNAPKLKGMSGGLILDYGDYNNVDVLSGKKPIDIRALAIPIAEIKQDRLIVGTRLDLVRQHMTNVLT
ncbi:MAG TPA: hypothetical protein DDY28_11055 [Hyphomonas atlantica]|nr:hypothetical protein [Hyphomonas atlantica]|tara:strand:- start:77 stop:895 length:819 start_codon:yes stop_codon:yes gene_type:complete